MTSASQTRAGSRIRRGGCILVCWALIALGAYSEHPFVRGFCERVVPIAMLFLTAITTAGCGGRILSFWSSQSKRPIESLCLSSALGWAVLSSALCILGALRQFTPSVLVPIAVICSLELGVGIRGGNSGWQIWRSVRWLGWIRIYRRKTATAVALISMLAVISVTWLWALSPVWDYDSEMYHLPNAAALLQQHGLVVSQQDSLANLPGQAYLWFALGLAANAEANPALLVCWATFLTSLLAASIASRWLGVRTGLWTMPVYWSALIVYAVASTPRIEPLYSLMFLAAVAWLLEALQQGRLNWSTIVFSGICLGTAASTKAQGLYGWPVIGVWWGVVWLCRRRWRTLRTLVQIACLFLIGFLILAPWWTKNWIAFGNPIHPMFSRQVDLDSLRNANPHVPNHRSRPWYFLARDTRDLFLKPDSFSGPPGQWPHYLFLLLPLLVVVLPRNSYRKGSEPIRQPFESRCLLVLVGLAAGYYGISLTLTHELRHQFGMFALASMLVSYVIAQFDLRWKMNVLLPGMVSGCLLFVVLFPGRIAGLPYVIRYALGSISAEKMREAVIRSSFPAACDWCNENLPRDANVLFCWESRIYRLHRSAIADPGACTWRTMFRGRVSADEVSDYLHQQQVDYVLVNEASLVYNVEKAGLFPKSVLDEFRSQRELLVPAVLDPVFTSDRNGSKTVAVYRVR